MGLGDAGAEGGRELVGRDRSRQPEQPQRTGAVSFGDAAARHGRSLPPGRRHRRLRESAHERRAAAPAPTGWAACRGRRRSGTASGTARAAPPALIAAASVAASTGVVGLLTPSVPVRSAGVFYLVAVLAISSIYGLWLGLATSLASAIAYNFFFLPPRHTLTISSSGDWLALAAFVVTALVTSHLASRERVEAEEAARRAAEAQLGERLATLIANGSRLQDALPLLGRQAARALGARDGGIHLGAPSPAGAGRPRGADRARRPPAGRAAPDRRARGARPTRPTPSGSAASWPGWSRSARSASSGSRTRSSPRRCGARTSSPPPSCAPSRTTSALR